MTADSFSFEYASESFLSTSVLPGVRPAPATESAIRVDVVDAVSPEFIEALSGDLGRHDGLLVGRSIDEATFVFDRNERVLELEYANGLTESRQAQVLLDWVVPYVLTELGQLVLHATAVNIDGAAWGFCGMSGRGKSTLAVSLAQSGYPLVADDTFVLDAHRTSVLPSHPSARLNNDSMRAVVDQDAVAASEKALLGDLELPFWETALPFGGVFLLEPAGEISIDSATAANVPDLLEQTYVLPGKGIANALDEVVALIEADSVHTLTYPRDYDVLPHVIETVERFAHLRSDGSS